MDPNLVIPRPLSLKTCIKRVSFRTIKDGSKNDTSFKTIGENDQKSTSFKAIVNRVKNLNPQYMVPIDEASQVISDPNVQKKGSASYRTAIQAVLHLQDQDSTPSYMEPGSVLINSTRDLQALFPQHGRQKVPIEYKEEIKKELAEMVLARKHHQADCAHTMGQQPDVPQKCKWQVEEYALTQGLEPSDKARATIIPWSSKLPTDIRPSISAQTLSPSGSSSKRRTALPGMRTPTCASRK